MAVECKSFLDNGVAQFRATRSWNYPVVFDQSCRPERFLSCRRATGKEFEPSAQAIRNWVAQADSVARHSLHVANIEGAPQWQAQRSSPYSDIELMTEKEVLGLKPAPRLEQIGD
jgi:hypothetical protein